MTKQLLQAKVLAAVRGGALQALQARSARERQEAAAGVAELCDQQCALQARCEQLELESSGSASMHASALSHATHSIGARASSSASFAASHAASRSCARRAARRARSSRLQERASCSRWRRARLFSTMGAWVPCS